MSADLLRRAAALMREHATVESTLREGDPYYAVQPMPDGSVITEMSGFEMRWHPAVALAVADLLDLAVPHEPVSHDYDECPVCRHVDDGSCEFYRRALSLAGAYLGEPG